MNCTITGQPQSPAIKEQVIAAIAKLDDISSATIHFAKCEQPYFAECWHRLKTNELRYDDRGYLVGDFLVIEEYDDECDRYSGRWLAYQMTHITNSETFGRGLMAGLVCHLAL